jgi:NAD(P) transhydrogenase subunit alpha
MVQRMAPGSVIVDVAAERGGNCALTHQGYTVVASGVTIIGCINIASSMPYHASYLYARNIMVFLLHLVHDGTVQLNLEDEILRETLLTRGGELVHARVRSSSRNPHW